MNVTTCHLWKDLCQASSWNMLIFEKEWNAFVCFQHHSKENLSFSMGKFTKLKTTFWSESNLLHLKNLHSRDYGFTIILLKVQKTFMTWPPFYYIWYSSICSRILNPPFLIICLIRIKSVGTKTNPPGTNANDNEQLSPITDIGNAP